MQAVIHPFLARLFWSSAIPDLRGMMRLSPYRFCNGTFISTKEHEFNIWPENDTEIGELVFFDFAGSGLVHLCGKRVYMCMQCHVCVKLTMIACMLQYTLVVTI